jgi:hypothetical protein
MTHYQFNAGALYRRSLKARLTSLRLPYTEESTLFESSFTVFARNEAEEFSLRLFRGYLSDLVARMAELERQELAEERREQEEQEAKKLKRKNHFRKLTFRRPL